MSSIEWFHNPEIIHMDAPASELIAAVDHGFPAASKSAILIQDAASNYYAFHPSRLRIKPWFAKMRRKRIGSVADYFDLEGETQAKCVFHVSRALSQPPRVFVELHEDGSIGRVGFPALDIVRVAPKTSPTEYTRMLGPFGGLKEVAPSAPSPASSPADTSVNRYPSVQTSAALAPGLAVDFIIDLPSTPPEGVTDPDIITITGLPGDWQEVAVQVELVSGHIEFPAPTGEIVLRRNGTSVACTIHGVVSSACAAGQEVFLIATFSFQNRRCGFIRRSFTLGAAASPPSGTPLAIDLAANPPVLTVSIFQIDPAAPGKLFWSLYVPPGLEIPGMPQRLNDMIDLGVDPASFIGALYKAFPQFEPGTHLAIFRGLGEELWKKSPAFFQNAYWAMRKELGEKFAIQFICTDPTVPWELMRPVSETEETDLLAMTHPVARCVGDSQGSLRHSLPAGKVVTIAPLYERVNDRLDRAQNESQLLQTRYAAVPVTGTYEEVWKLLTAGLDSGLVSVVHFAGHGEFAMGSPALSRLKLLADRHLTVLEVGTREVKLGRKTGCLVVFDACETGATGSLLGGVGGWARTLLEQRFGGFIAPLWAVDDDAAAVVAADLFEALLTLRIPVAQALLDIRRKYGATSPTYLAYLFYGDVGARIAA
jgi:hypothetical protein